MTFHCPYTDDGKCCAKIPEACQCVQYIRSYWRSYRPQGTIGFYYNNNEPKDSPFHLKERWRKYGWHE